MSFPPTARERASIVRTRAYREARARAMVSARVQGRDQALYWSATGEVRWLSCEAVRAVAFYADQMLGKVTLREAQAARA